MGKIDSKKMKLVKLATILSIISEGTSSSPSDTYRRKHAKDPISWIEDFKRETLETIGYLGRDHSGELFKKEESFRFEIRTLGDIRHSPPQSAHCSSSDSLMTLRLF